MKQKKGHNTHKIMKFEILEKTRNHQTMANIYYYIVLNKIIYIYTIII